MTYMQNLSSVSVSVSVPFEDVKNFHIVLLVHFSVFVFCQFSTCFAAQSSTLPGISQVISQLRFSPGCWVSTAGKCCLLN